jgi:hypothetical protein
LLLPLSVKWRRERSAGKEEKTKSHGLGESKNADEEGHGEEDNGEADKRGSRERATARWRQTNLFFAAGGWMKHGCFFLFCFCKGTPSFAAAAADENAENAISSTRTPRTQSTVPKEAHHQPIAKPCGFI